MNIRLDFGEVIDEFNLTAVQSADMANYVVQQTTNLVFQHWRAAAGRKLKSTRSSYIRGIQVVEEGRLTNSVVLFGKLNNMIEQGASPIDLKVGLLSSSNVKRDKEGNPYVSVPFRHAAASSLGENEAFSGVLPSTVQSALAKVQRSGGKKLSQSNIPAPFNQPRTRQAIQRTSNTPPYAAYTHKSSIYSGLERKGRKYHHQYMTFRRVSTKSDKNSWIHRGFQPYDLAGEAVRSANINNAVENFIDNYIGTL